jgi:tRNA 2-thiouridine synthesizing protein A
MSDQMDLNCVGMKCPRPIIEIAKAARKSAPGSILNVQADDLAFESDVNAWVENAGASILSLDKNGRNINVRIQLAK